MTVVTDEAKGEGWVVVVVEVVAGVAVVVPTGELEVVAARDVAPQPANATSPADVAKSVAQRRKIVTSRSVGAS